MKKNILLLSANLLILCNVVLSQQLNMTLNLNPFPSPYYSDWQRNPASIGFVTVFNNINYSGRTVFSIKIIQENIGLIFEGRSVPIYIHPVPVQTILGSYIADFDEVNLPNPKFKSIAIQTGRLGQGNFTLCLQILDQQTEQPLSDEVCGNFFINYPTPPRLITPIDNDTLEAAMYFPNFQWTPVSVPFGQKVRYIFRLVEVLEGQSKFQAIESNRPIYENLFLFNNNLTYPSNALPLEGEKTYAWQVQALDEYGLPLTQNDGKSEVFTFYKRKGEVFYKPPKKVMDLLPVVPFDKAIIYNQRPVFKFRINPETFPNVIYEFVIARKVVKDEEENFANYVVYNKIINGYDSKLTPEKPLPLDLNSEYLWRIVAFDTVENEIIQSSEIRSFVYKKTPSLQVPYTEVSGSLEFIYADPQAVQIFPPVVKKKNLKLVLKYSLQIKDKRPRGNPKFDFVNETKQGWILLEDSIASKFGKDLNKVISVCQTDSSGNFTFKFASFDTTKLVKRNFNLVFFAPDGDSIVYSGDVYRTARIVVDDIYFLSPDNDIIYNLFQKNDIGKLTSQVRVYTLKLNLIEAPLSQKTIYTNKPLDSVAVYLLRKTVPYNLPFDKCLPFADDKDSLFNMKVVAKTMSDLNGQAEFHLLSLNLNPSDEFFLYAESYQNGKHFHKSELISLRFDYTNYDGGRFYYTKKDINTDEILRIDSKYEALPSKFIKISDKAAFNNEYRHPVVYGNLYLYPRPPKIVGYCVDGEEPTKIVKNVKATLIKLDPWEIELEKYSDEDGTFVFDNLTTKLSEEYPYEAVYPKRKIIIEAPGYFPITVDIFGKQPNGALNYGEIVYLKSLVLNRIPRGRAILVDEDGNGIQAFYKIGDGSYEFINPFVKKFNDKFYYDSVVAFLEAPSLGKQKIIFIPRANSRKFSIDTIDANFTTYNVNLGEIKLLTKKHKISITVATEDSSETKKIAGAKVLLHNGSQIIERVTDEQGEAAFVFESSANKFKVIILPPLNLGLEKYVGTIVNLPSKLVNYYTINLKTAAVLYGKVLDEEGNPVDSAFVWADLGNSDYFTSSITKEDGSFVIGGLPFNSKFKLYASKVSKDTTIIGEVREFELNPENAPYPIVNLRLKYYDKIFLPKLFNLPVYLCDIKEIDTANYLISGFVKDFPDNSIFSPVAGETFLVFKDFPVVKSNQLKKQKIRYFYGLPKDSVLVFENYETSILYRNFLKGKLFSLDKLKLEKIKGGIYGLRGKVVFKTDYAGSMESLYDINEFSIAASDSTGLYLDVFTLTNFEIYPDVLTNKFYIVDSNGDDLRFKFLNFETRADKFTSRLDNHKLTLDIYSKINLRDILEASSEIRLGKLNVNLKEDLPPYSEEGFAIKLNLFKIDIEKWFVENGFLIAYDASLNHQATLRFNKLYFNSYGFGTAKFAESGSKILGAHEIKLRGKSSFDFCVDNSISLNALPDNNDFYVASISKLPGMRNDDYFAFESFFLNSNDNMFILNPVSYRSISLYEVAKVRLGKSNKISLRKDEISFPSLSFDLPNFELNAKAKYQNVNNEIQLVADNYYTNSFIVGDIKFATNPNEFHLSLTEKGAVINGKLYKENEFEFKSVIYKTKEKTYLETHSFIMGDSGKTPQRLLIQKNKYYLNEIYATSEVKNNQWMPLEISGTLSGLKEIDSSYIKLYFKADNQITAANQKLAFKNIPLYVGWINILYDWELDRFLGSSDFIMDFNGISFNGNLELKLDSLGWLFGGIADFYIPSVGETKGASLIGVYPLVEEKHKIIASRFSSYKTLLKEFPLSVDGVYFLGKRMFNLKYPEVIANFNYLTTKLSVDYSSDIYFYSSFLTPQRFYYLKAKIYATPEFIIDNVAFLKFKASQNYEGEFTANYDRIKQKFDFDGCISLPFEFEFRQALRGEFYEARSYDIAYDRNYESNLINMRININVNNKKNKGLQIKEGICK